MPEGLRGREIVLAGGSGGLGSESAELLAAEKAYSQELQRKGEWQSIWRCVGEYANISIFDVAGNEARMLEQREEQRNVRAYAEDGVAAQRRQRLLDVGEA